MKLSSKFCNSLKINPASFNTFNILTPAWRTSRASHWTRKVLLCFYFVFVTASSPTLRKNIVTSDANIIKKKPIKRQWEALKINSTDFQSLATINHNTCFVSHFLTLSQWCHLPLSISMNIAKILCWNFYKSNNNVCCLCFNQWQHVKDFDWHSNVQSKWNKQLL